MTNLAHDHSQVEAAAGVALVAAASLTADTVLPPPEAPAVIAPAPKPKPRPPSDASATLNHIRYVLGENPVTGFAFALFLLIVLAALFGPALVPYDPLASDTVAALKAPSAKHWFGTDQLGRDIFSRVVVATRLDFGIAVASVALVFVMGGLAGVAAGFYGGWTDRIVGRLADTIMAFPLFVLAMGIVAALGNTVQNIVLATAIVNFPLYARVARAEANVRREAGFVEAARLSGNSEFRILGFQVLPNVFPILVVQMSLTMGYAILNAAGLSFIGLGVRPPTAEWGIMVAEGAAFIVSGEWWIALFPGVALMVAVFCFNLLGDGVRDMVDPREAHMTAAPALEVENLSVEFRTRSGVVKALERVSFSIGKGETLALVGESGSGKSVTAYAVMGILDPAGRVTAGKAMLGGLDLLAASPDELAKVRGREIAMIFQNPRTALNPIRPVGRQIADMLIRHADVTRADAPGRAVELLRAVGITDPARRAKVYPFEMSGGMCQRVMIAIALAARPSLLIADEPTTGLDVTTQAVIMDLIGELASDIGMATIFITHDLALAAQRAAHIAVMHAGHVVELAPTRELFEHPRHPYTAELIAATPDTAADLNELASIPGSLPDLRRADLPPCRYSERCPRKLVACERPLPAPVADNPHLVACWNPL